MPIWFAYVKLLQTGLRLYYELMLPYFMFWQILSILLKRPALDQQFMLVPHGASIAYTEFGLV